MSTSSPDWANASAPGKAPIITSIFDFSAEALGQLKTWLEQSGLIIPSSQIAGGTSGSATRVTLAEFHAIATPTDAQSVTITNIDGATEWTFRYDGVAALWKFQYGTPLFARYDTAENPAAASNVWAEYANGPSKTIDQKGSYAVEFGATGTGNAAGTTSRTGFSVAAATPVAYVTYGFNDNVSSATAQAPVTIAANSTVVSLQHLDTNSARPISAGFRWMKITPISITI